MQFEIDAHVYHQVYQKLWEEFLRREWRGKKTLKIYSQLLWDAKDVEGEYIVIGKILLYTGLRDNKYFYKRYLSIKPKFSSKGEIDTLALYMALEYLGFKLTNDVDKNAELTSRTEDLLNQFENMYCPTDSKKTNKKEMKENPFEGAKKVVGLEQPNLVNSEDLNEIKIKETIKNLVIDFYSKIGLGHSEKAWELLSKNYQDKTWNGSLSRFISGYINTLGVYNITVLGVNKRHATVYEAQVAYDDDIAAYTSPDLNSLNAMTVGDLDQFVTNINAIKKKIDLIGGSGFESFPINKLFVKASSELIWYKCNVDPSLIAKVFPVRETVEVKRIVTCSCVLVDDNWVVNRIYGISI